MRVSRTHSFLSLLLALGLLWTGLTALEMMSARKQATDLEISGLLAGLSATETRFIRWADLAALPTTQLSLNDEFTPGPQTVTVVFLTDLWRALPLAPAADTLVATCTDGYASVYTNSCMVEDRPFLVLAINGVPSARWPPPGLKFNPGPYVISVSVTVAPAVAQLLDAGHKKPWGVNALRVARRDEAFAGFFRGEWARLSPRAAAGREIWINSCASCHCGPPDTFGGTKSGRTFEVVAGYAGQNPSYFRKYVRQPQALVPAAKMEPHPHYTDEQLSSLIAFLVAEPPP